MFEATCLSAQDQVRQTSRDKIATEKVDIVVVGAGQASLAMSEHLSRHSISPPCFGKNRIAESSQDMALARSMVANGYAYSLANIRMRAEFSPDGTPLKFVPRPGGVPPMRPSLLKGQRGHKPCIWAAFEDYCREIISQNDVPGLNMN